MIELFDKQGMKPTASGLQADGFTAGLWMLPFGLLILIGAPIGGRLAQRHAALREEMAAGARFISC